MTLQEVYVTYVEKAGKNFLNEAGENSRIDKVKASFNRFCERAQAKTVTKAQNQESVEM